MKLKVEHIAPYLPYNLKAQFKAVEKPTCRKMVIGTIGAVYCDATICCFDTVNSSPVKYKPLLRPLSDLIKEIEIDGKIVIPIVELAKVESNSFRNITEVFKTDDDTDSYDFGVSYHDVFGANALYVSLRSNSMFYNSRGSISDSSRNQYQLFQKLFELHFDVFGLIEKGLAIKY
jgi:hypothetical protein